MCRISLPDQNYSFEYQTSVINQRGTFTFKLPVGNNFSSNKNILLIEFRLLATLTIGTNYKRSYFLISK